MQFRDREEAGLVLAQALLAYRGADALIYALPRGGVVLGRIVADTLALPWDIAIARKIGHPDNPEYAICAVSEGGTLICNEDERKRLSEEWLRQEARKERAEAERRRALYGAGRAELSPYGKTAIVVDDGIATGLTMLAILRELRRMNPAKIVVAVPCAPLEVVTVLERDANEVIVLTAGEPYRGAVGAYYDSFPQVSDDEVISLLW